MSHVGREANELGSESRVPKVRIDAKFLSSLCIALPTFCFCSCSARTVMVEHTTGGKISHILAGFQYG